RRRCPFADTGSRAHAPSIRPVRAIATARDDACRPIVVRPSGARVGCALADCEYRQGSAGGEDLALARTCIECQLEVRRRDRGSPGVRIRRAGDLACPCLLLDWIGSQPAHATAWRSVSLGRYA